MGPKKNQSTLVALMKEHGMTADDVAIALHRSPSLVYQWRSKAGADMPDTMMDLLKLKIDAGLVSGSKGKKK